MRAGAVLVCVLVASSGAPAAGAGEAADNQLPENWYRIQPWAEQPPVNVFKRVAAVQSALGGLQHSVNAYSSALRAQADAHNQRVLMQAELARVEAMQPKPEPRRSNFKTRGTPEQIDAAARAYGPQISGKTLGYSVPYSGLTTQQSIDLANATLDGAVAFDRGWLAFTKHRMDAVPK